jgi:hypothetical protein
MSEMDTGLQIKLRLGNILRYRRRDIPWERHPFRAETFHFGEVAERLKATAC